MLGSNLAINNPRRHVTRPSMSVGSMVGIEILDYDPNNHNNEESQTVSNLRRGGGGGGGGTSGGGVGGGGDNNDRERKGTLSVVGRGDSGGYLEKPLPLGAKDSTIPSVG